MLQALEAVLGQCHPACLSAVKPCSRRLMRPQNLMVGMSSWQPAFTQCTSDLLHRLPLATVDFFCFSHTFGFFQSAVSHHLGFHASSLIPIRALTIVDFVDIITSLLILAP